MHRLKEGPFFSVSPEIWRDVGMTNIVKLGIDNIGPTAMRDQGFFRVSTNGWNETFFDKYVKSAVDEGTFGQIKYGAKNVSQSVVRDCQNIPGWRESRQPYGKHGTATMKELFEEFRAQWNTAANNGVKKMLSQGDQQSAEFLPSLATGKRFFYGESYSGCVNESPIAEVEKIGDLELPVNILLLYLRFHVLFHNYIAAKGVSGLWTYAYGPFSGTVLHLEDGFLPSINMNLGPGWKMWYFVPRSHFKEMQTLYARVGLIPNGDGCCHHFQHKRLAPSIETLLDAGIPVCYLVQRPGDIVFVDGCVFHEVINWGYGFSQAINILLPSWVHVGEAGVYLRAECCVAFINDEEFSAKALTDRLSELFKRIRATNASPSDLAQRDTAIGRLTRIKWQPAKPKYAKYCIGFGDPVTGADLAPHLSGLFTCRLSDIRPDAKSPAAETVTSLPASPEKRLFWIAPKSRALPEKTEESSPRRKSTRKRGPSPCYVYCDIPSSPRKKSTSQAR